VTAPSLLAPRPFVRPRTETIVSLLALQAALALLFVGGKRALEVVPPLTLEATRRIAATVILVALVARREGLLSLRAVAMPNADAAGKLGRPFPRRGSSRNACVRMMPVP
jgi:hypothetical protein